MSELQDFGFMLTEFRVNYPQKFLYPNKSTLIFSVERVQATTPIFWYYTTFYREFLLNNNGEVIRHLPSSE